MNKLLVALGLAATVALVGCNKDKAPETGATTGEHLENAAQQASADIKSAGDKAADDMQLQPIMLLRRSMLQPITLLMRLLKLQLKQKLLHVKRLLIQLKLLKTPLLK